MKCLFGKLSALELEPFGLQRGRVAAIRMGKLLKQLCNDPDLCENYAAVFRAEPRSTEASFLAMFNLSRGRIEHFGRLAGGHVLCHCA